MKKAEKIIVTISIIALGLKLIFVPGSGVLTVLTFSTLSIIYFYFGFALFNDISIRKIFKKDSYKDVSKYRLIGAFGAGLALSLTTVGIMFKFQSWPGASINLGAGLLGLLIVAIAGLIKYSKTKADYYLKILKRTAIFGGLGLILFILPQGTWISIKYRDEPAFVNAYHKALADPDNQDLWDEVEVERQKMQNRKPQ